MIQESEFHVTNTTEGDQEEIKSDVDPFLASKPKKVITLDSYINDFWLDIDKRFQFEFMDKPLFKLVFDQPNAQ